MIFARADFVSVLGASHHVGQWVCSNLVGSAGSSASSISTEKQFRNPSEAYGSDDCSEAYPTPPGWSKRQKAEAITQGSKCAKEEKWSCEAAVNATATGSVDQTGNGHDRE
jgi:hypothetical protein